METTLQPSIVDSSCAQHNRVESFDGTGLRGNLRGRPPAINVQMDAFIALPQTRVERGPPDLQTVTGHTHARMVNPKGMQSYASVRVGVRRASRWGKRD